MHSPTPGQGSPPAGQRGAVSINTDLPPRPSPGTAEALPLPEPRRWLPYNRSLLQALIFLQTCTFSAFAAPSCGDSASVQTRGQLQTGRDGIPPLPPPAARRGDGGGSGGQAVPPAPARPRQRAGLAEQAMPRAPRPPAQPGQDRQLWGQRHSRHCPAKCATSPRVCL